MQVLLKLISFWRPISRTILILPDCGKVFFYEAEHKLLTMTLHTI